MSKIHIKYMTDEALETLKASTDTVTGKLIENPKSSAWLKTFFPGTLWVTKKYEIIKNKGVLFLTRQRVTVLWSGSGRF